MELWPPHLYRSDGHIRGVPPSVVEAAIQQAHEAQKHNVPPILSLKHLAWHTDTSYEHLRDVVGRRFDPYRSFPISKRAGGYRVVCVPEPELLRLQRWLQRFVLSSLTPHKTSYAYAAGCSPIDCARAHVGCKWLVKVDIQQFFESISEKEVYAVFRGLAYRPLVSFELSRLVTRVSESPHRYKKKRWMNEKTSRYKLSAYSDKRLGHLPQGAPTSPMLSNLVMMKFDERADLIAADEDAVYTRYSDDLVFSSGASDFTRARATRLIARVGQLLEDCQLNLNASKSRIEPPGARKAVLGLLVDGDRVRLTKEFRRSLECHVHYVTRFGYATHAVERNFHSSFALFRHLCGLISYAHQVDAAFADDLASDLSQVPPPF